MAIEVSSHNREERYMQKQEIMYRNNIEIYAVPHIDNDHVEILIFPFYYVLSRNNEIKHVLRYNITFFLHCATQS